MKKFNKDKYLKKLRFKKNVCVFILIVAILGICFLCLNKYDFDDKSMDNVVGAYIDGECSKTIPGKNTGYVVEKVICDNEATGEWDSVKWGLFTSNLTKKTKCNVYFKSTKIINIINKIDTLNCPMVNFDGTVSVTGSENEQSLIVRLLTIMA